MQMNQRLVTTLKAPAVVAAMLATVALSVGSAQAAVITSLGVDADTDAEWRTTTTVKPTAFDPNGDNIYGNDGYYFGYSDLGAANDNIEAGNIKQSNPTYISSITPSGNFFVSDAYVNFDDPAATPGAAVADVNGALYYNSGTKFSFTVSEATEFVLTVVIGSNPGSGGPTGISVVQTAGSGSGSATNNSLPTAVLGEYAFFNIDAAAGDSFNVNITASSSTGITGIAFEDTFIPEPASLALLGLGGLLIAGRNRRPA